MDTARTKLSITLDPDIVKEIDRAVQMRVAGSRSAVIEKWLRRASRLDAEARLREATIAYYESLSKADVADDMALSRASSKAARRVALDE
jgi:metal-responsive CopG/Arc/MetJ family transcriptional regulator